jgi:Fe-S oxidoreductase
MSNPTLTNLEYCTYCPKMCRHACPVSTTTGNETWIPQAKMSTLNLALKQQLPFTREATEPIWACTGCRQCTEYCRHGIEPGAVLFAGRAEAQRRGVAPAALERYPERFRAREERLAKHARAALPRPADNVQVAYWPGCDALDKGEADVRATLALLERAGGEPVGLADVDRVCGGYPLLAAGHLDTFRWHAARVAADLARYRDVVLGCSACVHALKTLYPAEGVHVAPTIRHVSELGAERASALTASGQPAVYYHDPCYLARYAGVMDAPRQLLGRVAQVRELAWSHKDTECCGGGGLLPKTMPRVADAMARRRLAEVADAGGGTVVTSCGTCKHMLARNAPDGVIVRDLMEYVEARTR